MGPGLLDWVELAGVGGQGVDAQSRPGRGESPHGGGDVTVEIVPDEHDRAVELLMGGVEQGGEVGFTKPLPLTRPSFVDHGTVDEATGCPDR